MAAKTVQLGSFCGGTSKLVDSTFMGMEESVNMYPETVEATDTYSRKMLKSIEGFEKFSSTRLKKYLAIYLASVSPKNCKAAGGPVLYGVSEYGVERIYEDGTCEYFYDFGATSDITETGSWETVELDANDTVSICENSSSSPFLIICARISFYSKKRLIWCVNLLDDRPAPVNPIPGSCEYSITNISLPDAFDHEGKVSPTKVAFLNYRVVINDEDSDYIYWSELNKPDGVDDQHAFQQKLTRYTYTKNDGTRVTADDNQYYAPAYGTYVANTLQTEDVWMGALNNIKVDFRADNVKSLLALDKCLVVLGSTSYQLLQWQNSQYCPFVSEYQKSSIGLRSSETAVVQDGAVYFLGYGSSGMNSVFRLNESGIEKISTTAISQKIASVNDQEKSFAISYTYKGHSFYVLTFYGENDDFTICYDITEGVWHTRATIDKYGNLKHWDVKLAVSAYNNVFFIPESVNSLFKFNKDSFVDVNGNPIPRIRTTGIKFDGGNDIIAHTLELVTDNGATKDFELNPRVMLQVSTDGGYTWSSEKWAKSGMMGRYNYRTIFEGLGAGAKLAFRVKMTDPAPFNIATAFLTYTPCKNRIF